MHFNFIRIVLGLGSGRLGNTSEISSTQNSPVTCLMVYVFGFSLNLSTFYNSIYKWAKKQCKPHSKCLVVHIVSVALFYNLFPLLRQERLLILTTGDSVVSGAEPIYKAHSGVMPSICSGTLVSGGFHPWGEGRNIKCWFVSSQSPRLEWSSAWIACLPRWGPHVKSR